MDLDDEETLTLDRAALQADVAHLYASADGLLRPEVRDDLLERWREPHRRYHGVSHLTAGLRALDQLGAGRLEQVAYWFHDVVHTNTTPDDEQRSAQLAREWLAPHLPADEVEEVARLILLTVHHRPDADDQAGWRVCDADLVGLGQPWEVYAANAQGIRQEIPGLSDEQWQQRRLDFLDDFLARPTVYGTSHAQQHWEATARANLRRELELRRPGSAR